MKLPRRKFLHLAAGAASLPALPCIAPAEAYPTRPVRIIVGFPPGGTADIVARLAGQILSERLGQPFVVENRPGAGGTVADQAAVSAPHDGYTLVLGGLNQAINVTLYDKLQFHPRPRAGRGHDPHTACHGGESSVSGQDGAGVHCLREGQSRQDQRGIRRQRDSESHVRRVVQDDDRPQYGPCSLSGDGTGVD